MTRVKAFLRVRASVSACAREREFRSPSCRAFREFVCEAAGRLFRKLHPIREGQAL